MEEETPSTKRTFSDEFRREAVKLVRRPGVKVTHCAGPGHIAERAVSMGQPEAWKCARQATQQAIAQRVGI